MVHHSISQGESQNHQRCFSTCSVETRSNVQFSWIQRCFYPVLVLVAADLLTCLTITDTKVVYRRYASLFFIAGCASTDNELITLEIVHRYVEQMDKYYGNVCELDIIFNFQKAYFILDELILAGEMQESSKKNVLRVISQQDSLEDMEVSQFNHTPMDQSAVCLSPDWPQSDHYTPFYRAEHHWLICPSTGRIRSHQNHVNNKTKTSYFQSHKKCYGHWLCSHHNRQTKQTRLFKISKQSGSTMNDRLWPFDKEAEKSWRTDLHTIEVCATMSTTSQPATDSYRKVISSPNTIRLVRAALQMLLNASTYSHILMEWSMMLDVKIDIQKALHGEYRASTTKSVRAIQIITFTEILNERYSWTQELASVVPFCSLTSLWAEFYHVHRCDCYDWLTRSQPLFTWCEPGRNQLRCRLQGSPLISQPTTTSQSQQRHAIYTQELLLLGILPGCILLPQRRLCRQLWWIWTRNDCPNLTKRPRVLIICCANDHQDQKLFISIPQLIWERLRSFHRYCSAVVCQPRTISLVERLN